MICCKESCICMQIVHDMDGILCLLIKKLLIGRILCLNFQKKKRRDFKLPEDRPIPPIRQWGRLARIEEVIGRAWRRKAIISGIPHTSVIPGHAREGNREDIIAETIQKHQRALHAPGAIHNKIGIFPFIIGDIDIKEKKKKGFRMREMSKIQASCKIEVLVS